MTRSSFVRLFILFALMVSMLAGCDKRSGEWRCYADTDYSKKGAVLAKLTRSVLDESGEVPGAAGTGDVSIVGAAHVAFFRVDEQNNRKWSFGGGVVPRKTGEAIFGRSFVITPDGLGLYYDFSTSEDGRGELIESFNCGRHSRIFKQS